MQTDALEAPLGTLTAIASPSEETAKERAYRLQDYAAQLLDSERISKCLRAIAPGSHGVSVMYAPSEGRAYYKGLYLCNQVWLCPVCSSRITAEKRKDLSKALASAKLHGWTPVMITTTLQHDRSHTCEESLKALLTAERSMTSGKWFQWLKQEYSWAGSVRTLEVTYTENGWHTHCHKLVFLDLKDSDGNPLTADALAIIAGGLQRLYSEQWNKVLRRVNRRAGAEHGVHIRIADADIAEYVAKFGHEPEGHWGAADEMSRAPMKKAKEKHGLSPFQLLEAYGNPDSDLLEKHPNVVKSRAQAGTLFLEYAKAFKRRNQLVWSRGLRDALDMAEEVPDEAITEAELEAEPEIQPVEMALFMPDAWRQIVRNKKRGELLTVAATGDIDFLRAWLRWLGIGHVDLNDYSMPPPGQRWPR